MNRLVALMLLISIMTGIRARTIVLDSDGEPMTGAVVLDKDSALICIVDTLGAVPAYALDRYPLTLVCMGFDPVSVDASIDTIVMKPTVHQLSEVVVNTKERPGMYLLCNVCETTSITDGADTIIVNIQYMCDYVLPAYQGAKCKTWEEPRVLKKDVKWRSTNSKMTYKDYPIKEFGLTFATLNKKPLVLADSLKGVRQGTYTVRNGKWDVNTYRFSPTTTSVINDALAECKDHTFNMPGIIKMLGFACSVTECWRQCLYDYNDLGVYNASSLMAKAESFKMICEGKGWKSLSPSGILPIIVYSYVEVFPVDVSYLTKEEVKELSKELPKCEMKTVARTF